MKEAELNNKMRQSIHQFESLEDIQTSPEWTRTMMNRFAQAERPAKPGFSASSIALVLIFFVLANIGVILTLISDSNRRTSSRSSDLRTISNEFLINPTSINQ